MQLGGSVDGHIIYVEPSEVEVEEVPRLDTRHHIHALAAGQVMDLLREGSHAVTICVTRYPFFGQSVTLCVRLRVELHGFSRALRWHRVCV